MLEGMNGHFSEDLFLKNTTGKYLYETYAKEMPILDYHCHLLPQEIFENKEFEDLGEMWLAHDHYKWRAMRTFGIEEKFITGSASFYEKYLAFATIFPKLVGNPIYIWCALELKRYFDIEEPLDAENAPRIYAMTKTLIAQNHITPRWCMEKSKVEVVCTTEDPIDSLSYHYKMRENSSAKTRILSAYRPDRAMFCEKEDFSSYIQLLSQAACLPIDSFSGLFKALEQRLQIFKEIGSTVSDNGIPDFTWVDYTDEEIASVFEKALRGEILSSLEIDRYRSAFLFEIARIYKRNGFVMQLHIGTYLDTNTGKVAIIGHSTGFDCIDDSTRIKSVGTLLDKLSTLGELPKTILYPLDGTKIEAYAVLAAGFCEGGIRAKVQLGAPWWFNDQSFGIQRQFEAVANLYPLSLSVGMLTDSRSFLSYPRHELYRRVLCNFLGSLVENGEYFGKESDIATVIRDVCYYNAKAFFSF
ncbi:glucuronate isomerase [uncultured Sphaerochaeta sp.]|uniref:glucuronate isomerase n=1 Tax=uncultured Sphaerochaeta sp. TaxID=886478 RepID=UPI002A0A4312|nr:glucuronate isomerase [uncultured Sphaerochaeta sp.]